MLNITIPKEHYSAMATPLLEERADGAVVPVAIGDIHNIIPVCIDTVGQTYEICGHPIHDVTEVRSSDGVILADPADYDLNGDNNWIELNATPLLASGTTYYFVVRVDYGMDPNNHLTFIRKDGYAGHSLYTVDNTGAWLIDPLVHDLQFKIFGKVSLDGTESIMVNNGGAPNSGFIGLNDALVRTRVGQSFTPATAFYATRIRLYFTKHGAPTGNVYVAILSDYTPAEVQIGVESTATVIPTGVGPSGTVQTPKFMLFPQRAEVNGVVVDIEGAERVGFPGNPIVDGADALQYLVETVLDKSPLLLDATYLADLKADRTQEVKLWLDKDTTFGAVVGKLESSLLFKLVPLLDGTYCTVVYEGGEDSNTPHFTDEDYLSFNLRYDWSALKSKIVIKYDEDAGGQIGFKVEEISSDFARFFYESEETLEVETYHRTQPGAAWLAGELSGMYETPPIIAEFEVHGWGLDLIPGRDKVNLTRARAGYAGGTLNDELFRIIRLVKKPGTSTVVITAQLDTQTY